MRNFILKVKNIIKETPDAYSLILENHEKLKGYQAGQFVNVQVKIDNQIIERSYSFSSSPIVDPFPALTIKKVREGKVSNHLYKELKCGDLISISKPLGRFTLDKETNNGRILLLAGGSGITPIFGLLKEGIERYPFTKFILIYANRDEHIIFKDALNELYVKYNDRLELHYFVENGELENFGSVLHRGRVSYDFIRDILESNNNISTSYVCGPEGMMKQCINWLYNLGMKKEQVRTEYFTFSNKPQKDQANIKETPSSVTILNTLGEKYTLNVPFYSNILGHFLENNIRLPHSCREGMCGSCVAKVVKGKVKMKNNYALNDEKVKNGYILLCQSIPSATQVELVYD